MSPLRALTDQAAGGSRLLLRVDHNVPLDAAGGVADETRLVRTLPTIERLSTLGARVILLAHWGYPGGRPDPRLSTAALRDRLARHIRRDVRFCPTADPGAMAAHVDALRDGDLLYVENVRFLAGEERNDPTLAAGWRQLADGYVSEAFSVCHRSHASVAALPTLLPAFAAPAFLHEHAQLTALLEGPRPRALVLAGGKVRQKLALVPALLSHFDLVALGGRCAVDAAVQLGLLPSAAPHASDPAPSDTRADALAQVCLPHDWRIRRNGTCTTVASARVTNAADIVDIGEDSLQALLARLAACKTIFWNGPLGRYEEPDGSGATAALSRALVDHHRAGTRVAIGGGDTIAAVQANGHAAEIGFVSTAGGAALAYLAGGDTLPGIQPLLLS